MYVCMYMANYLSGFCKAIHVAHVVPGGLGLLPGSYASDGQLWRG